jgi:hypothetical protein
MKSSSWRSIRVAGVAGHRATDLGVDRDRDQGAVQDVDVRFVG